MTVRLERNYDVWLIEFQRCKKEIEQLCKNLNLQIEHIGSTSIEGLMAKPILDIGIGINDEGAKNEVIKLLSINGYIDRGDRKERGGYLLVKCIAPEVVSHHIHILNISDAQWGNYLKFRDSLQQSKKLRQEYELLKLNLIDEHDGNREKYTNGKNEFVTRVLDGSINSSES